MTQQSANLFLTANAKKFDTMAIPMIQQHLAALPENKAALLSAADFKDPTLILVLSLFFGGLGVDRFLLGDTGMGILKLLTGGLFGILTIIDWFSVQKKTKEKNFEEFMRIVNM